MKKLIDYTENPKDLIGKLVLVRGHGTFHSKELRKIEKVFKKTFSISGHPNVKFHLNGSQKGGDHWSRSVCELISEEDALKLKEEWRKNRSIHDIRGRLETKMDTLTYDQWIAIDKVIGE